MCGGRGSLATVEAVTVRFPAIASRYTVHTRDLEPFAGVYWGISQEYLDTGSSYETVWRFTDSVALDGTPLGTVDVIANHIIELREGY